MPMQGAIDVDRGVQIRQIVKFDSRFRFDGDERFGGMTVFMYKDTPGVYYDTHGNKVPAHIAKLAGYPVEQYAKELKKMLAMKDFEAKLKAQLDLDTDEAEVVLAEAGNWKVISLPMQRARVVDIETGSYVTPLPMPEAEALLLLQSLTQTEDAVNIEDVSTPTQDASSQKGGSNGRSAS